MIIAEPNKFVAEVHDRMPVLLSEKDYEPWLSGKAGVEMLKPAAKNVLQKMAGVKAGQFLACAGR
jgi:putative SOS response-associated peptidase YedK